jgi:hypothetical protein
MSFSSMVLQALQSRSAPSTRIGSRPVIVEEMFGNWLKIRIGTVTALAA